MNEALEQVVKRYIEDGQDPVARQLLEALMEENSTLLDVIENARLSTTNLEGFIKGIRFEGVASPAMMEVILPISSQSRMLMSVDKISITPVTEVVSRSRPNRRVSRRIK